MKEQLKNSWNKKILDYEIETLNEGVESRLALLRWNKKILDYEIETPAQNGAAPRCWYRWNKKILDYEIETDPSIWGCDTCFAVEIRRFSITRLKRILNPNIYAVREKLK